MALISTIILFITAIVFFFGQLLRLDINNISFPAIDICITLLFLTNIFTHFKNKTLKIKNKYFFYFLIFTWISFLVNLINYHTDILRSLLYLIRLNILISFFIFPITFSTPKFKNFFYITIIANIIFGFIQYFFYPDFTAFKSLNWDPHLYRLISTFFDPTFTGLIYLLFLIIIFLKKNFPLRIPLLILSYTAIALTYSRSTYLSFLIAFTFIAKAQKKPKIFLISLILIISTICLMPRQAGEGTKLERTSSIKAKIENYKEGISVFIKSPIIGHGYNNLFSVRQINNPDSHANSGFDGSLLTILATTGIIGFILFTLGLKHYFISADFTQKTLLITILFHSLFANSLLYPWVLLFLLLV